MRLESNLHGALSLRSVQRRLMNNSLVCGVAAKKPLVSFEKGYIEALNVKNVPKKKIALRICRDRLTVSQYLSTGQKYPKNQRVEEKQNFNPCEKTNFEACNLIKNMSTRKIKNI